MVKKGKYFLFLLAFLALAPKASAKILIPDAFYFHSQKWLLQCVAAGLGPQNQWCNIGPAQIISLLLPNVLVIAGIIFFALILFGGFGMIVGAGHEANSQSAAKSKAAVTYGLVGFLLVISAFFILQIIGTITGVDFITPPNI